MSVKRKYVWYFCAVPQLLHIIVILPMCKSLFIERLFFSFSLFFLLLSSPEHIQHRLTDSLCRQPVDIGYYYYFSFVHCKPCCEPSPLDTFFHSFTPFCVVLSFWCTKLSIFYLFPSAHSTSNIKWKTTICLVYSVIFSVKNYVEIKFYVCYYFFIIFFSWFSRRHSPRYMENTLYFLSLKEFFKLII